MKIKVGLLVSLLAVSLLTVFLFSGAVVAEPNSSSGTNSVRITVGNGPPVTNVSEGDVVHREERTAPSPGDDSDDNTPECDIPRVRIQMSGDVSSVRVGVREGTCDLVVKSLIMNNTPMPPPEEGEPREQFSTGFNTRAGFEWYVESLAKVVGVNSIDDLTKTYAWFNFETANFTGGGSLYDGSDPGGECWAANFPQPIFYYYVDSCTRSSTDVSSSSEMHVEVEGEYYNSQVSVFDHDVTSKAIARGYRKMPHVFDSDCSEDGVVYSLGQDFECELYWEYEGYSSD